MRKETQTRLVRHITFLGNELKDYEKFRSLSWEEYNEERDKRRNVERWVENIVNSTIDISKIILASEGNPLPDTYRGIVASLSSVSGFDREIMKSLSEWVDLRNILAHEYLDVRWNSIKRFIHESDPIYRIFYEKVKEYINKEIY